MTDDPRDILKAAGAECAEMDEFERIDRRGFRDDWGPISPQKAMDAADAAILALARLVAPLARFLNAERALNDPEITEGTTHRQTDAHVESDKAYREACAALGVDSFLDEHNA